MKQHKLCCYVGYLDEKFICHNFGEDVYRRLKGNEEYQGKYKNDTYNGIGLYRSEAFFYPWTYEGGFFSNRKEGYGNLSYPDGSYFQGLFKEDTQFGPGVFSEIQGTEDVGFWVGSKIVRLSQKVGAIEKLATSPEAKAKIVRYKKLVTVSTPREDVAAKIMKEIGADGDTIQNKSNKLYSVHCKESTSLLFDMEGFTKAFHDDLIRVEVPIIAILSRDNLTTNVRKNIKAISKAVQDEEHEKGSSGNSDVSVEVLAWNNGELPSELLKHSFRFHQYEDSTGTNVRNILLRNRSHFKPAGEKETACVAMLQRSSEGDLVGVSSLIVNYKLYPNLGDSNGNSGLMRAAAQDDHEMVKLFFNFDADMNILNDEGFSSLTHCLTRYISVKNEITDWGDSFLPPFTMDDGTRGKLEWMAQLSRLSLEKLRGKKSGKRNEKDKKKHKKGKQERKYIFDLRPASAPKPEKDEKTGKKSSKQSSEKNESRNLTKKELAKKEAELKKEKEKQDKLDVIQSTIILLLNLGIDPNASEVPAPPLLLAIYAGNILLVEMLLKLGANPNARLLPDEGSLTILHVICLLPPNSYYPIIASLLLSYGADPNNEADPNYDPEAQSFLYADFPPLSFPVTGMKPLEALCLRLDANYVEGKEYLEELCKVLGDCTSHEKHYLGHSSLTLAIARGNDGLVRSLLSCSTVHPNEHVDQHLGVPLTVLMKYLGDSGNPRAITIIKDLDDNGANSLRIVNMLGRPKGNVHNYTQDELKLMRSIEKSLPSSAKTSTKGKEKKEIKETNTKQSEEKSSKKKTESTQENIHNRVENYRSLTELLEKVMRNKLNMNIKGILVRSLIAEIRAGNMDPDNRIIVQSKNWLTAEEFVDILNANVKVNRVFIKKSEVDTALDLLMLQPTENFETLNHTLNTHKRPMSKGKKGKKEAEDKVTATTNRKSKTEMMKELSGALKKSKQIFDILEDKWKSKKFKIVLPSCDFDRHPELDIKPGLYEVCYRCGIRSPTLQLCPTCLLVRFCSQQCNYRDYKDPTSLHKCATIFFKADLGRHGSKLGLLDTTGKLKYHDVGKEIKKGQKGDRDDKLGKKGKKGEGDDKLSESDKRKAKIRALDKKKDGGSVTDYDGKLDGRGEDGGKLNDGTTGEMKAGEEEGGEKGGRNLSGEEGMESDGLRERKDRNIFQFRNLVLEFCDEFDLDNYLPFIVLRDGSFYYKFYGETVRNAENYSFN